MFRIESFVPVAKDEIWVRALGALVHAITISASTPAGGTIRRLLSLNSRRGGTFLPTKTLAPT